MSPNGDGHVIGYQDPPSLPSVNNCLWIITTNVIYYMSLYTYLSMGARTAGFEPPRGRGARNPG